MNKTIKYLFFYWKYIFTGKTRIEQSWPEVFAELEFIKEGKRSGYCNIETNEIDWLLKRNEELVN